MIRRQILLAAAAIMAGAGRSFGQSASPGSDQPDSGAPWQLRPFLLEDVNGAVADDAALHGKFALVFFGYTSCPDICPTTLTTIGQALKGLGPEADKVLPLFVSLDPERDSRKVLSQYTQAIDPHIVGLRGPKAYVDAMAKNFGVAYRRRSCNKKFTRLSPRRQRHDDAARRAAFRLGVAGAISFRQRVHETRAAAFEARCSRSAA
jgi:protein SCO1/2